MRITCTHCAKIIDLPENKLPDANRFSVKCPHCAEKTSVDRAKAQLAKGAAPGSEIAGFEPEVFPTESQVAFVFLEDKNWKAKIEQYYRKKGGYVSSSGDSEGGVRKLQLNRYDVIYLEDNDDTAPMLREVSSWPGTKRRRVNCILIGDKAKSFDPQESFVRGVNAYLNIRDSVEAEDFIHKVEAAFDQRNELWYLASQSE